MVEKGAITLYLAEWQKRMISDYIPDLKLIHKVKLIVAEEQKHILLYKQILVMYRPRIEAGALNSWNLYLTDEQIHHLSEETGGKVKFTAINITPELLKTKAVVFE